MISRPLTYIPLLAIVCFYSTCLQVQSQETFAPLNGKQPPQNYEQLWSDFDPRAEPLETEVLKEWEQDGVIMRVVRFRIGIFKGKKAKLAGIYGFPKDPKAKLPGLLQIHGGGQYADYRACLTNAKRGYATISIAWAGRISAPAYQVSPPEVKLFWDQKTDDPKYKLTTDWGAVDGYHAPARNKGNQFPSADAAKWTLDSVESPRNSGWFLCAVAARRALTFLEQQKEVDGKRLGVYGHSMGGKLTVMTAPDSRVVAAAPSCGGISDRQNRSPLFRKTLGDDVYLKNIKCPIIFLSPANDFHGRIGDLPAAIDEIKSKQWRVTCSPHHNHQDTPDFEVATQLWMDQHLKQKFKFPAAPSTELKLRTENGVPKLELSPEPNRQILSVDVFYTQQGKENESPKYRLDTIHRFWYHAKPVKKDDTWHASLPLPSNSKPLWVFANVRYKLPKSIRGAGYYYGEYETRSFNVSSLLVKVPASKIESAKVSPSMQLTQLIEDFQGEWKKDWFSYRNTTWALMTNKLNSEVWKAPADAKLRLDVKSASQNKMVVLLDEYATEIQLEGKGQRQTFLFDLSDFKNYDGESPTNWSVVRLLKLSPAEHLRPGRGKPGKRRIIGGSWKGDPPTFEQLRWQISKE